MTVSEYHRPGTLEEALELLRREDTAPLAGGSALNKPGGAPVAAVDLQALGLSSVQRRGNTLEVGATATLQQLLEGAVEDASLALPEALVEAIRREAARNLRQVASVAGTLVAAGGRSPFTTALLALDAGLVIMAGGPQSGGSQSVGQQMSLGDLLPQRGERLRGRLITQVNIPLNARLAYAASARTPADRPIVCAAAAVWPSGRTRVALGGFGAAPLLAFDGTEAEGAVIAAQSAYSQAGDAWATAEYRREAAGALVGRCLEEVNS